MTRPLSVHYSNNSAAPPVITSRVPSQHGWLPQSAIQTISLPRLLKLMGILPLLFSQQILTILLFPPNKGPQSQPKQMSTQSVPPVSHPPPPRSFANVPLPHAKQLQWGWILTLMKVYLLVCKRTLLINVWTNSSPPPTGAKIKPSPPTSTCVHSWCLLGYVSWKLIHKLGLT